jgi:predicted Fe-Mo cluster-binding NifX family protein
MKIAVSSHNLKTVTGHAGKCRYFWLYDVYDAEVRAKRLIQLANDQTYHERHDSGPRPLEGIDVLIAGGLGSRLHQRLKQRGVMAVATTETNPDRAVAAWLDGSLVEIAPEAREHQPAHVHDHW